MGMEEPILTSRSGLLLVLALDIVLARVREETASGDRRGVGDVEGQRVGILARGHDRHVGDDRRLRVQREVPRHLLLRTGRSVGLGLDDQRVDPVG